MHYQTIIPTPLGDWTLVSDGENLVGLWKPEQKHFGGSLQGHWQTRDDLKVFALAKDWLAQYFSGAQPSLRDLPLAPEGTPFQQLVWQKLLAIPYGSVTTYRDIAKEVAVSLQRASMSAQAVGSAVGKNPLSIIIPCHRVIGADGALVGFGGGLPTKHFLLRLEGALPAEQAGLF